MTTAPNHPVAAPPPAKLVGEVAYFFSYDVAYDMDRRPIGRLLGQKVSQYQATVLRGPRQQFFYSPQMVTLPPESRVGPDGPVSVRRVVKIFAVGAISIAYHVPFAVNSLDDLRRYHDLEMDGQFLQDDARELANTIVRELGRSLIHPVGSVRDEEAYTVFCLDVDALSADGGFVSDRWLAANGRAIAGLLNNDQADMLSDSEARDTVSNTLTYHRDDLVVMDWDAAIVIDHPAGLEEVLHVIELVNVQSAELEAYDRYLDETLDRSYRDLARPRRKTRMTLRSLREIRLDLSRLSDELSNTTKFFGDWHLARVYQRLFVLFHLDDWQKVIDEKLRTLGEMYGLLAQDRNNRWMMALEVTIVLLFIIDLAIILWLGKM
ncbi:MAG: hypothetical protein PHU85_20505 [Phycisphaerae bacterium]|nr:hypothetical protein [Phycisphaerae bacterium]